MAELKELTAIEFKRFVDFIYKASGIRIPDSKRTLLSNRIRRRLKAGDFPDYLTYFRHLSAPDGSNELSGFLDAVTTNETSFFRTPKHFDWFRTEFVTQMTSEARAGKRPKSLRIWSAACSTGEEPYSIAICLAENMLRLKDWSLEILGSDLNEDVLERARQGVYSESAIQPLDEKQRRRFLQQRKDRGDWEVKQSLKDLTKFRRHNLMDSMSEGPFDCTFIRNVLIYFDVKSKQQVVQNLISAMSSGSYLVVGPSEGIYDMLGALKKHSTFCYEKP